MAAGYELVKNEQKSCLLVWDINHQNPKDKNETSNQKKDFNLIDAQVGHLLNIASPDPIYQEKFTFTEVNEDVLSLKWIPNSATEMVVATENSLMICDTRDSSWPVRNLIEE